SFATNGGLISYGPDPTERYKRSAALIAKILKGNRPADLPVEQPTKFDLVINLKATKQIDLTIPPRVLARADRLSGDRASGSRLHHTNTGIFSLLCYYFARTICHYVFESVKGGSENSR
ncbi:MAG TPA: ABC transporter substrate binding protein, partial [Candidatus Binatia bacterium]